MGRLLCAASSWLVAQFPAPLWDAAEPSRTSLALPRPLPYDRWSRRMSTAARVLLVSLLLVMSAAPSASAGGGWSLVPSGASRPSFYAEGVPGAVLQDTVSVVNRSGR